MSMKRAKRAGSTGRGSQSEGSLSSFSGPATAVTWKDAVSDKADDAFKPYAMTNTYAKGDLIAHPKFGKGIVTLVEGSRVEILFEDAARKLSHGATI